MAGMFRTVLLHAGMSREPHTRTRIGWWAWLLQRVSGILLVGYLFLHIAVISTSQAGADTFDNVLVFVQHPVFATLNIILIAIVLYHTFNGVRVILFDLGIGIGRQASLVWASAILTGVGTGASAYLSIPLIFR
jgi:succinate dehydrogenase / fumarate reductase cytochrome b subunit